MVTYETHRLFFIIALFWVVLAEGKNDCSLWVPDKKVLSKMPLAYTLDDQQEASIIYPNIQEHLEVENNKDLVFSCTTTYFVLEALEETNEILVTCLGGVKLLYQGQIYDYSDFQCMHVPKSTLKVTDRVCQPNNNTVITVGFDTKNYYFTLYSICFDMDKKNSLYTWYNVRVPFYDHYQYRTRPRLFTQDTEIYGDLKVGVLYKKDMQRETVNNILKLPFDSEKIIQAEERSSESNYLTRGHLVAKTDFYYAREQLATFSYANVVPQWFQINFQWAEIEEAVKSELAKNIYSRRVIVSGVYGSCTVLDEDNVPQPLFLVYPEKYLAVPMFLWKLIYDADDERNNVVYICPNNPYANREAVEAEKLRCDQIPCPGYIRPQIAYLVYCCTKNSFDRAYGQLKPDVFYVPTWESRQNPVPAA